MIPAIACAIASIPLMFAEYHDKPGLKSIAKFFASASFLVYAFSVADYTNWFHHKSITAGLWFGFIGDMCLLSKRQSLFMLGIGAFLINHILYIVSFYLMGVSGFAILASSLPCAVGGFLVWKWMKPHIPKDLLIPVALYTVVIASMICFSISAVIYQPTFDRYWLLLAAVMFFISDLFVARDRFMVHDAWNMAVNVPLYFAAQLMFGHFGCTAW